MPAWTLAPVLVRVAACALLVLQPLVGGSVACPMYRIHADGGAVGYAYDRVGNRTTMFDSLGATSYGYDQLYRLVQTTDPFGATVGREYDANGNRTAWL